MVNKVLNSIMDETGKTKSDSFIHLVNEYITLVSDSDKDVSTSIKLVLKEIKEKGCNYLRHRDNGFVCLALAYKNKSEKSLGISPKEVKDLCLACLKRQKEIEDERIKREMQKATVKKLSEFASIFKKIVGRGVLKDLFFCFHDIFEEESKIIFSSNGKTIKCPLKNMATILMKEECEQIVNPDSDKPPCKFFVPIEYLLRISEEELKESGLVFPEIEFYEGEEEDEEIETKITVDAEYEVVEDDKEEGKKE